MVACGAADDACTGGCSLAAAPGAAVVCGTDGITYASACLAACAGATKLHDGPCGPLATLGGPSPPSTSAAAAEQAASSGAAGGALQDHPIGRFLNVASTGDADAGPAGAAASPLTVTAQDVARFKSEGMVLVGAAKLADFTPGKALVGEDGGYP